LQGQQLRILNYNLNGINEISSMGKISQVKSRFLITIKKAEMGIFA
jgi:hypothetical protein